MSDEEDRVAEQLAAQLSVAAKHADEMTVDEKVQLITRNLQETYVPNLPEICQSCNLII